MTCPTCLGSGLDGSKGTSLQGIVTDMLPVGAIVNGNRVLISKKYLITSLLPSEAPDRLIFNELKV